MGRTLLLLTCYHALLFRRFYFQNSYVYARSEALEQGFASSQLLGAALRAGRRVDDRYFFPDYRALPVLSGYYPPHLVQAWIGSFLSLNHAWILYSLTMVSHFWLSSVSVYILAIHMGYAPLIAGFASVTLSSLGYAMKQNSCITYTCAWVPVWLLSLQAGNWCLAGTSLGMMLLAGY